MDIVISVVAFLLGSVLSRFAEVIASRCPRKLSPLMVRAHCQACQTPLAVWARIPVLSHLFLNGNCRHCNAKIGFFRVCNALMGGVGFLAVVRMCERRGARFIEMLLLFGLLFLFSVMAAVDYETHAVYNNTLILFALLTVLLLMERRAFRLPELWDHLGGLVFGTAFFLSVAFVGKAVLKRDALGMGDVFIAGIGGLLLGTFPCLLAVLVSSFLGSVTELCKIKFGRAERGAELAFAPYLLFGIGLFTVCGQEISDCFWRVVL